MYDLYHCDKYDTSRYILGKSGTRIIFVIGLNPSTATNEKYDVTVAKVEKAALNNGYSGFVMANLCPLRRTHPNDLPKDYNRSLFYNNLRMIKKLASSESQPTFWAAWGGDITLRSYLIEAFIRLIGVAESIKGRWVHYGELRKDGHPRHPSRLSYKWKFNDFDATAYRRRFKS
jgi:hypothetical protein